MPLQADAAPPTADSIKFACKVASILVVRAVKHRASIAFLAVFAS